jgi:hypothetical protein
MRTLILTVIMILGLSLSVMASYDREWDATDAFLLTTRIIDTYQTFDIKNIYTTIRTSDNQTIVVPALEEKNPILGKSPSDQDICIYFIGLFVLDRLNDKYSPDWLHKTWEYMQITAELYCVTTNIQIRLKFKI